MFQYNNLTLSLVVRKPALFYKWLIKLKKLRNQGVVWAWAGCDDMVNDIEPFSELTQSLLDLILFLSLNADYFDRLCPLYNKFRTNFLIHTCIWSTPLALPTEFGEGQWCLCRSGLALSRNEANSQLSLTPGDCGEREIERKCLYSWWNIMEYGHKWKSTFINE